MFSESTETNVLRTAPSNIFFKCFPYKFRADKYGIEPGIHLVMFLEAEDDLEVSAEAVPDELEVLRHGVHHGAQAGQARAHHYTQKRAL